MTLFFSAGNGQVTSMVQLPGGRFQMGTNSPDSRDGEGPIREVTVKPFAIDIFPVTNKDFRYLYCCAAGLYDLVGNVWEWTASPYQGAGQDMRVLPGASWIDRSDGSANHRARITTRMGNTPDSASDNPGFRCASGVGRLPGELEQPCRAKEKSPLWYPCHSLVTFQTQPNSRLFNFSFRSDLLPLPPALCDRHLSPGQVRPLTTEEGCHCLLGKCPNLLIVAGSWVFL
ncbi:PREDICTED: sulfatase-modifying factor 2 [Hipposideros armiger]|uniref:Sulfatase-modifying factor 2 n=1 Tax=Hipposideros armiger TaxID=186990 RepID=A0A8B7QHD8_HIPAR|nr:PREDICTED: sulfatase-modifying factor 2 [Hipposideros armiger]